MRNVLQILAVFIMSLLMVSAVTAGHNGYSDVDESRAEALDLVSSLSVVSVEVNGNDVRTGEVLAVEEGEALDVKVGLEAFNNVDDIEVEAKISGYEYSDYENLEDATHLFDMSSNTTKYVNLEVSLPSQLDKDVYWLRVRVMNRHSVSVEQVVELHVEPSRHAVDIADVAFSPGSSVKAGRSLLTTVLLENFGDRNQRDVKVTVAIPQLGVSATEFVDRVDTDRETYRNNFDFEDVPEMFLAIPATATEGDYEVVVTASYDNMRETVTKKSMIHVVANEIFQATDKLVLAVGPENQAVVAGKTATYAIALTNAGATSKAYVLSSVVGDWATAVLSDNLVVLEPGKNKVVYVEVTPAMDATAGEHIASVEVKSGNEVLETVTFKAAVSAASQPSVGANFSLRNGLEIALIVLVVLLVIIGLIVGFSRLRKDGDEEGQTYY
ncbi:TPA: hypothetical protein HA241_02660 [Candidatus Woesearchaeota archaeon]|nr:hypothetical protein [Candidatus Woesearchaeota archaeon]